LLVLEEEQEEAPGFDAEALEDEIEEIVGEYEGVYGVSVLEPDSGTRVSLRGDEEFVAASIGKLPPFAALYAAAARGRGRPGRRNLHPRRGRTELRLG
jgi:beta-lactamase class A